MKKFLLTTAAILVLLLVCFAGYVQYRKWYSFQTLIPKDATAVIRINVYGMARSAAWDYLSESAERSKKDEDEGKSEGIGLQLPANAFVYSVARKAPTTFFTSLEITDFKDFERTLKKRLKDLETDRSDALVSVATGTDKKLTIAYNKTTAAFAYAWNSEETISVLKEIVLGKNAVRFNDSRFKNVLDCPDHICYADAENKGTLNFVEGAITGEGNFVFDQIIVAEKNEHPANLPQNCITGWLNADVSKLLAGKTFTIDQYTLQADSLLKYYQNAATLDLNGTVAQKETIVTYGYNDNFEKEEKTEVRETMVPGIQLHLRAAPQLLNYLKRQGIIQGDSGTVNRKVFPLYQLYALNAAKGLQLSTTNGFQNTTATIADSSFAGLDVSFDLLEKQQQFPAICSYIHALKSLQMRAKSTNRGHVQIQLSIHFDRSSQNALLQIAEMF